MKWIKVVKNNYFYDQTRGNPMANFIGDYSVRLDPKGRLSFPAAFKKQIREALQDGFVLKRDVFEPCLIMYPMEEWERQTKMIRARTNPYNKEHARFLRMFFSGTAEVSLDANNRMLIPKRLLDYAEIGAEVVMAGQSGKIEIWASEKYGGVSEVDEDFAAMAEKILGGTFDEPEK
ncbi:MAG: division/cell wall cluster transcriptional repressor MraZ [Bacteroides sp.]|nr:division/cell wall cluster transcriptional repressor MraZ [Bacteroides sp.]